MAAALLLRSTFLPSSVAPVQYNRWKPLRSSVARPPQAKIHEILMPAMSSTMTEGKVVGWLKTEGEPVAKYESIAVIESDKADMEMESFHDGFLAAILVPEGSTAPVGSAIGLLAEDQDDVSKARSNYAPAASSAAAPQAPASTPPPTQEVTIHDIASAVSSVVPEPVNVSTGRVIASPYAKKLAKEFNVDLKRLTGTGPGGRIVAKDVELAAAATVAALATDKEVKVQSDVAFSAGKGTELAGKTVPFSTMQGAVSRNMVESLSVPTFRVGYTISTDALDALYKKIKPKGVTMTALLAKAAAMALKQHPVVNSSCRDGKSFTYNSSINIAVAVAIDGGLITPVLQDADKVDIYSLSRKWKELVDKARAKQLQPHEYNTGTFTLSNLGMFGVDRFDAILPPGTGAIMAVGASQPTVVATSDGRIGVQSQMQVNVTADHRVIYGADLAAFLQTLSKIIEDPRDLTF